MIRRDFLKAGIFSGTTLICNNLTAADITGNKSVIYIFLSGGISQVETINPIPSAPVEYRSVRGNVKTRSGYVLGGDFQEMANISDKFTTVRSFHQISPNHATATVNVNTGIMGKKDTPEEPSYGSIIAHQFGTNSLGGVPHYVTVGKFAGTEPVWLGKKYDGFSPTSDGIANLSSRVSLERLKDRLSLIVEKDIPRAESWVDLREQATEILKGSAAEAFKTELEPENVQEMYGVKSSSFGRDLLKARRLVEHGSKFITITTGGFDNHSGINSNFERRGPELDKYISTLILDLESRGLLNNTMVVITTEFGRTSRINSNYSSGGPGRDHQSSNVPLILAGGEYNHGSVIGETDRVAKEIISNKFMPRDLIRTIMDHMEIDENLVIYDKQNRPRHIVSHESRNILV